MTTTLRSTRRSANGAAVPSFFWDRDVGVEELHGILADSSHPERLDLLAVLLREARVDEVWLFVTPEDVRDALPAVSHRLGRRRDFWPWLIASWQELGLLD